MGSDEGEGDGRKANSMPVTVPERAWPNATVAIPPLASNLALAGIARGAADSSPPRSQAATAGMTLSPSVQDRRDRIAHATSSLDAILSEIRKPPQGRLHIESRAASGGMGSIDIAVDRGLDRRIAVKTLHPHLRPSESSVRMFLREARLTGLLEHPHIVPVYDIGERDSDQLYFAMKLVEGQTLHDVIRALPRGPLDTATLYAILDVVAKVCDALAFAHSRGVIHCDIKPANVMVGEFGQVYLMDWGIARLVVCEASPSSAHDPDARLGEGSATDNSVIGTPCYMSPEQARGDRNKLDARSDVFLIGSLLYEILTRRPPYSSSDRSETLSLAANVTFPGPRKVTNDGSVPPELERIVLCCMQRRPEDRYPSVAALREDLVRFMRGGGDFPRKAFAAGATIIREGETGDAAYIIVAGRCEIQKETPNGTETLMSVGPGAVFGEMSIMTEGPRTATVVATEPTTVLVVTSAILEKEMDALKPWIATLLKSLAARFRDIDTKHRATYATALSPDRLANHILMIVGTWGEPTHNGGRFMKWTELSAELEELLGHAPLSVFGVAARYGLILDLEANRLTIPDLAALTARLKADLGR